jgi:hypothetical protein
VTRRARALLALAVGALAAAEIWVKTAHSGAVSDFDLVWHAARVLAQGANPYEMIGPERPIYFGWPLYYPLPAILVVSPLAAVPIHLARSLFVGAAVGSFVYASTRDGAARLALLASVPMLHAVQLAQWSPLLSAMYFLPGLAWLSVAKPNIGLALLAASPSGKAVRIAAAGGGLLVLLRLRAPSGWVGYWLDAIRDAPHIAAPVTRAGGPLLLLALLRWRRPEARLLAALACVPQTPCFYEALPVLLVASGLREVLALVLLSDLSFVVALQLTAGEHVDGRECPAVRPAHQRLLLPPGARPRAAASERGHAPGLARSGADSVLGRRASGTAACES